MNTPKNVIDNFANVGIAKAQLRGGKLMLLSMMAGAYIAIGGVLSVVAGFGFPELTAGNPSLQRLLSGAAFPIGLILVVILGAELFTGNNAVLMPAALQAKYRRGQPCATGLPSISAILWARCSSRCFSYMPSDSPPQSPTIAPCSASPKRKLRCRGTSCCSKASAPTGLSALPCGSPPLQRQCSPRWQAAGCP